MSHLSVLILTKNEAQDLPGCLRTISWSDDVHVFDSYSSDETVAVARNAGAHVYQRQFTDYADQRNAALTTVPFRNEWVLILDADERVPDALREEMTAFVRTAPPIIAGARIRRRDFLFGTWLKHAQISPYYIRLVRPKKVHYEREINEVLVPHGPILDLREPFDHFPFSKGMAHWLDKHNRYSSMEALRAHKERATAMSFSWREALFSRDFNVRRVHQKGLYYRIPGRTALKFFYMLVWRRSFMDGWAGFTYCVLQCIYEYFIVLKEREIEQAAGTGGNSVR
jgi:glycosyltransferase involved in cell wall biosynthesis